jgi:hypothetical protein
VFLTGNPGGTQRMLTEAQLEYQREARYPRVRTMIDQRLEVLREFAAADAGAEKRLRTSILSLENGQKLYRGEHGALLDPAFQAKKHAAELAFQRRAKAAGHDDAMAIWDELATLMVEKKALEAPLNLQTTGGLPLLLRALALVEFATSGDAKKREARSRPAVPAIRCRRRCSSTTWPRAAPRCRPDDPYVGAAARRSPTPKDAATRLLEKSRLGDDAELERLLAGGARRSPRTPIRRCRRRARSCRCCRQNLARQARIDAARRRSANGWRACCSRSTATTCRRTRRSRCAGATAACRLSVQRHAGAVAHGVPRPVRARRRVRRRAPVRPAGRSGSWPDRIDMRHRSTSSARSTRPAATRAARSSTSGSNSSGCCSTATSSRWATSSSTASGWSAVSASTRRASSRRCARSTRQAPVARTGALTARRGRAAAQLPWRTPAT